MKYSASMYVELFWRFSIQPNLAIFIAKIANFEREKIVNLFFQILVPSNNMKKSTLTRRSHGKYICPPTYLCTPIDLPLLFLVKKWRTSSETQVNNDFFIYVVTVWK